MQHTAVHQQVQELGEEERVAVHPPEQCGAGVLAQFGAAEVVAQQSRRGGLRQRRQGEQLRVGQPGQGRGLTVEQDEQDRSAQPAGETP